MVPLQVSARLAPQPVTSQPVKNDSDDDDHDDNDPDYDPLDETEYDEDCYHGSYTLRSHAPPEERRQCQKCHHGMPWSNLLLAGSIVIRRSQVPANTQTS